MLGVYTRWFNDWALLIGWAVGIIAGTAMAIAVNLTPTYPLALAGYTFPGYSALYTVMLTPILNTVSSKRTPMDATVPADYRA
jgi:SSS family solute:Na+ symporter